MYMYHVIRNPYCIDHSTSKLILIKKYGSTFYIGIAIVVSPYIGTMGGLGLGLHLRDMA